MDPFCTEGSLISHPFVRKSIFKNVPFSVAHPVRFGRGVTTPRFDADLSGLLKSIVSCIFQLFE